MTITHTYDHSFFKDLAALLTGQLVLPEDGVYEQVRQLWNGRVTTHPAAFVRCANTQDIIHTVQWARSHGLPLSVLRAYSETCDTMKGKRSREAR